MWVILGDRVGPGSGMLFNRKRGGGPERETDVRDGKLSLRARVSWHSYQRARCEKCLRTRIWPRVCVCVIMCYNAHATLARRSSGHVLVS